MGRKDEYTERVDKSKWLKDGRIKDIMKIKIR